MNEQSVERANNMIKDLKTQGGICSAWVLYEYTDGESITSMPEQKIYITNKYKEGNAGVAYTKYNKETKFVDCYIIWL
jgi:hypothetical protein